MSTTHSSVNRGSARLAGKARPRPQISETVAPRTPRFFLAAAGVAVVVLGSACSTSPAPSPDGGGGAAGSGNACTDIQDAYASAVSKAQECTVGAAAQCGVQARASFWCNCTISVNDGAATLMAIADQYKAAGCLTVCNGTCAQPRSFTCQADATSSTGGRCKPALQLDLGADSDGGTFAVPVGYEVDILLGSVGPNNYGMNVVLSSDAVTVLEVTIPAGTQNPGGPTYLYRLKAVSAGQVVVEIPHLMATTDASLPSYRITLNIS